MFDRIARRYDLMNRLLSFGLDRRWRRHLLDALGEVAPGDALLDVATGTADVALAMAARFEGAEVVGLDPSYGMLAVGREKIARRGMDARVSLVAGDAQALPFPDGRFAATAIAFGIRNVPDRLRALREFARVTRPGGRVVVLELSEPRRGALAPLARFHVHRVVPWLGSLLSGAREYRYLQQSIAAFPPAESFAALMAEAGLEVRSVRRETLGTAHLYTAQVPPRAHTLA
ncbi:MAG: class I SAM-dependent methyltransferase [Deltaproteobacteria bacterium]|nr:class I SAM-dependent methyltransferase [Deltaproteobacteria bacterium]